MSVKTDAPEAVVRLVARAAARDLVEVTGRVAVIESAETPSLRLEVIVEDPTGQLRCTFFGRRSIPGISCGSLLHVEGRLVVFRGRPCLLNPVYELLAGTCSASTASS